MNKESLEILCGRNLRKFIKEKKQTQQSFADDYGVDLRTVSRWINEGKLTDLRDLQELAKYFKKEVIEFFYDA